MTRIGLQCDKTGVLLRGERDTRDLSPCAWGKGHMGGSEKVTVSKIGRAVSPKANPTGTFVLDFRPQEQ